jgi:hypothetical protein
VLTAGCSQLATLQHCPSQIRSLRTSGTQQIGIIEQEEEEEEEHGEEQGRRMERGEREEREERSSQKEIERNHRLFDLILKNDAVVDCGVAHIQVPYCPLYSFIY